MCCAPRAGPGAITRIALCDPDCAHARERDRLESLNNVLPEHIRAALRHLTAEGPIPGLSVALHERHLCSTIYRFDDRMLLSTHLVEERGHQHPVWRLCRRATNGMFDRYLGEFERIWAGSHPFAPAGR